MDTRTNKYLHVFTPVRRTDATLIGKQLYAEPEKEWTAARCQRLLRTLTSRVAVLRKDIARFSTVRHTRKRAEEVAINSTASSELTAGKDTGWTKGRKKIRTYGKARKGGSSKSQISEYPGPVKARKSILPGEVLVPTPILARVRGDYRPEAHVPTVVEPEGQEDKSKRRRINHKMASSNGQFQLSATLRELRRSTAAARYTTYEGIYYGLDTLLRTTSTKEVGVRVKGARPLLSVALSAVPHYILQQETLHQKHLQETGGKSTIENRDISREIYDDLESYGSFGHGWKRLKDVIRAHGVQVVCDAITEGLFEVDYCGTLISLCVHSNAVDEAQRLLSALLSSPCYPRPNTLYESPGKPISMLQKFTEHTRRTPFLYRELCRLITDNVLPLEWLATKALGPVWTGVIRSLTPDSVEHEALIFCRVVLSRLLEFSSSVKCQGASRRKALSMANSIDDAVRNTFSSLLTTLLALLLLNSNISQHSDPASAANSGEFDHLKSILTNSLVRPTDKRKKNDQYVLLLLANLILQHELTSTPTKLLLHELSIELQGGDRSFSCAQAAMFICQVARCCGKGTSGLGFDYLQLLHLRLQDLACSSDESNFLKGLIVDSAFVFARKIPDRQHIDYAANLDAKYCTRTDHIDASWLSMTDGEVEENRSGFRWEEGIGEWVTATPATSKTKRKAVEDVPHESIDSPFRPPPNLRRLLDRTPSTVSHFMPSSDGFDELESANPVVASSLSIQMTSEAMNSVSDEELLLAAQSFTVDDVSDEMSPYSPGRNFPQTEVTPQFVSNDSKMLFGECRQNHSPQSVPWKYISDGETEVTGEEIENLFQDSPQAKRFLVGGSRAPQVKRHSIDCAPRLQRSVFQTQSRVYLYNSSLSTISASPISVGEQSDQRSCVDRAPRLGRRALRNSQVWKIFSESEDNDEEDELSFVSSATSQSCSRSWALRDLTTQFAPTSQPATSAVSKTNLQRQPTQSTTAKLCPRFDVDDSEDELCI